MKVAAIIVTYNRLELLKECLSAVRQQTLPVNEILVVNNASTDGTEKFLATQEDVRVVNLDKNIGGAGGFSYGIREACGNADNDALWIMDDDTIATPTALEILVRQMEKEPELGFVCSKVVWKDGAVHWMNIPGFVTDDDKDASLRQVRSASFVSLLVPTKIVREVGLPYKEFFIWADDAEFTSRIHKEAGYKALLVNDSVVVHKTAVNYGAGIDRATVANAWKFYYLMRNGMFCCRHERPYLLWLFRELNHLRLYLHRVNKMPKEDRKVFKDNLIRGFKDGLTFRPKREFL